MTNVDAKVLPFSRVDSYMTTGVKVRMGVGETVAVRFNFGSTDINMAYHGMLPSVQIAWTEDGVDKIGFNGALSVGNTVEIKHPDTYITQFILIPMYISNTSTEKGGQEVEIFLLEIYG